MKNDPVFPLGWNKQFVCIKLLYANAPHKSTITNMAMVHVPCLVSYACHKAFLIEDEKEDAIASADGCIHCRHLRLV